MWVPHFTKYGIILDDDSSAEDEGEEKTKKIEKNQNYEDKFENDESETEEEEKKQIDNENLKKFPIKFEKIQPNMPAIEESSLSKEEKVDEKSEILKKEPEVAENYLKIEEFESYSEILRNFEDESQLKQDEIEPICLKEIICFKKIEKDENNKKDNGIEKKINIKREENEIIKKINKFYSKVNGNQTRNEEFYQNSSFRVSWCQNGFVSLGDNKDGSFSVNINKIIVHPELLEKKEYDSKIDYQKYLKDLEKFKEKYRIFFKCFFQDYHFQDQNFQQFKKGWNKKKLFMERILAYIYEYSSYLKNSKFDEKAREMFFQGEIIYLSLLDILFGESCSQMIKLFSSFQKGNFTSKMLEFLIKKLNSGKPKNEAETRTLLGMWFEKKAEPVKKNQIFD